jgi:hypothetical protein
MVENNSNDDTVSTFLKWGIRMGVPSVKDFSPNPEKDFFPPYARAEDVGPLPASNHTNIASVWALSFSNGQGQKALSVLALARNGYLGMLRSHPWYSDVDFLFPVDTDMCYAWRVKRQEHPPAEGWDGVWTNLLLAEKRWDLIERGIDPNLPPKLRDTTKTADPLFGNETRLQWSVLFPNGVCGWYLPLIPRNATHRDYQVPPYHPQSFAFYCDRFAYKDTIVGRGSGNQHFWWNSSLPYGGCSPYPGKWDRFDCHHLGLGKPIEHHATRTGAEPWTKVISAFGGAAMYSAALLRLRTDCSYTSGGDCEHIGFNECLGRDPVDLAENGGQSAKLTKAAGQKSKKKPRSGKAELGIAGRWIVDWEGCGSPLPS